MTSRRTLATLALVALVALAGCGATGGGSGGGADGGYQQATELAASGAKATGAPTGTPVAGDAASGGGGSGSGVAVNVQQRKVIKTGTVVVTVDDFERARANITSAVEGYGGYVSDTSQERREIDNETWVRGQVVLRVPQDRFDDLVDDAKALGEVESVETNARDVTGQIVDIQARLENLRAERDRLRELYDQANTTEDVLAVQRELSDVQGEIERLEARLQSLQNQVAYSTLTVRLEEPRPTPNRVAPDRWYDTPVLSAFLQSVDGVVVVARAIVVGLAYALPYLIAFGLPVVLVGGAIWRYRGRFGLPSRGDGG
ncbi:DUF4349 domain-containing protein [Halobellus sp. EA9]|uniref:DUF4349 domain-containing protein n=1 Tax=Halobellus sp. EA9 TaxID=3421647 RepID=UPI003EBCD378